MTQELSEAEAAKVAAFGFDKEPDMTERAERISFRAADIADLAAGLLAATVAEVSRS